MNEKFFVLKHRHDKDYLQRLERDDPQRFWRGRSGSVPPRRGEELVREKHRRRYLSSHIPLGNGDGAPPGAAKGEGQPAWVFLPF